MLRQALLSRRLRASRDPAARSLAFGRGVHHDGPVADDLLNRGERMDPEDDVATAETDPAGAGPGGGTPYTVYFPSQDGYRAADLAHAAPPPQVGDLVGSLHESGCPDRYRVRQGV